MLPHHHAGLEVFVEPGPGAHAALDRLDRHPVTVRDLSRLCSRGMQLHFRVRRALAETRERVMLRLAEDGGFRARQDEREARGQVGPRDGTDFGLREVGQWRVAVIEEGLRIELDLARWCREPGWRPVRT